MAKIDGKNEFAVCGMKKEKEIHPSFAVKLQK